jgi:hypothetical protein
LGDPPSVDLPTPTISGLSAGDAAAPGAAASSSNGESPASRIRSLPRLDPYAGIAADTPVAEPGSGGGSPTGDAPASATPTAGAPTSPTQRLADTPAPAGASGDRAVPQPYSLRQGKDRLERAKRYGATQESENAVDAALAWLARNQSSNGRWDASQFGAGDERRVLGHDRQRAGSGADAGVTGLALLAFLGAGHTHLEGPHADTVTRGLDYLISIQRDDGSLGGEAATFAYMYCHAMATFALSEAYALTDDSRIAPAVRRAVAYTLRAQHPTTGGWRYRPGDLGDTSQLGWQVMVLKSAQLGGVEVPDDALRRAARYLDSVASGRQGGLASYRPRERPSHTMTAEALAARQFLGAPPSGGAADEAASLLLTSAPNQTEVNVYYWYYATLAMFQLQGEPWQRWNEALQPTLIARQHAAGELAGSWPPSTVWGGYGGRVYSTALATLCLEVYYRYLPIYGDSAETVGRARGAGRNALR